MNLRKKLVAVAVIIMLLVVLPILAAETQGRVVSVSPDTKTFVLTDTFRNMTFHLAANGKVFINEQERPLSHMQAGDEAHVTYEKQGKQLIASMVRCKRR